MSLGGSTSGHMMDSLKAKTLNNPATNPFLKLLNASNGAGTSSINSISDPNDPYWDHVSNIIRSSRVSYSQIQVVYLESEDSSSIVGFPARPYLLRDNLKTAIQTCKAKFPKLKLLYVLGRTTTFNVHSVQNQEPAPYYNGWAEKFLIEDQINGVQVQNIKEIVLLLLWLRGAGINGQMEQIFQGRMVLHGKKAIQMMAFMLHLKEKIHFPPAFKIFYSQISMRAFGTQIILSPG